MNLFLLVHQFITYSTTNQSLNVTRCPFFTDLIKTCNPKAKVARERVTREYISHHYLCFKNIVEMEFRLCELFYCSTPYAQLMHDGGTLKNRDKYHSVGVKYIMPFNLTIVAQFLAKAAEASKTQSKTKPTVEQLFKLAAVRKGLEELRTTPAALTFEPNNVAVMFSPQEASGSGADVAAQIGGNFKEVTKLEIERVTRAAISDAAAMGVAGNLGSSSSSFSSSSEAKEQEQKEDEVAIDIVDIVDMVPAEGQEAKEEEEEDEDDSSAAVTAQLCQMHNLSKVMSWLLGLLLKSNNKQPVDPFNQGKHIVMLANKVAKFFNYGGRRKKLRQISKSLNVTLNHPHVNVNGTRVDAAVRVLTHVLHKELSVKAISASDASFTIRITDADWALMAELEGLALAVGKFVKIVQTETCFTGGYRAIIFLSLR